MELQKIRKGWLLWGEVKKLFLDFTSNLHYVEFHKEPICLLHLGGSLNSHKFLIYFTVSSNCLQIMVHTIRTKLPVERFQASTAVYLGYAVAQLV